MIRSALGLALLVATLACTHPPVRTVVLLTLDTTRADRLGCYGYTAGRTPALDGFAKEAVQFDQAQTPIPVTLPSHTTMFTGLYPPLHGVRYNGMFHVSEKSVLLAERLQEVGWRTAAVPASFPVARSTGLAQGFEVYRDLFSEQRGSLPVDAERNAEEVTRLGIEWLEAHPEGPAFLWLHYFDAHSPYEPPFPYSAEFRDRPYDGEIAYMDAQVGKFLEGLRRLGRWDDALVIVVGDHGEGLYEHGEARHADLVYQSTLHVPLLIKAPGIRGGRRVATPVSLVDLYPTVLELGELSIPPIDGRSLVPALRGEQLPVRAVYFESLADSLLYGWSPLEGVRRGDWKYTRSSEPELYDLASDPSEKVNRHGTDADVARDLEAELTARMASWGGGSAEVAPTPLDPEAMARMASLGYVGGAVSDARRGGRAPRRGIHLGSTMSEGNALAEAGRAREALARWNVVLAEDPLNRYVLMRATYACAELGDYAGAAAHAQTLVDTYPEFVPGVVLRGTLWVRSGKPERAIEVFAAGLKQQPKDDVLRYNHALALLSAARVPEAEKALDDLLASDPDTPNFWLARGAARAREGDLAGAQTDLDEGIRRGFSDRNALDSEPLLAPLRRLPGFAAARSRVGTPPSPAS